MTKFFHVLILLFICGSATSQHSDYVNYNVVNTALSELTASINKKDSIRINCYTISFIEQKTFFTKEFLESFTFPVVGVNSAKVKRLLKLLDFKYLRDEKSEIITLDTTKLNYKSVLLFDRNNVNLLDGKKRYMFSEPLFVSNKKIAFISIRIECGYMDCSSTFVNVYKKHGDKWVFYIKIPLY